MTEFAAEEKPAIRNDCCVMTDDDAALIGHFVILFDGILTLVVGLFGILGNSLAVSVLLAKEMRNAFNYLMIVLAVVDSVFIGFVIINTSIVEAFGVSQLLINSATDVMRVTVN